MNIFLSCIFWLLVFSFLGPTVTCLTDNSIKKQREKYEHLNILIDDFQDQGWKDEEAICVELLLKIMRNVQNSTLWATWIWESMQYPVGHLYGSKNNYGNYDECLDFPWEKVHPDMKTKYCLVYIKLSDVAFQTDEMNLFGDVKNYLRTRTKHHLYFNTLNWGICIPEACKTESIAKFVSVMFRQTHLGLAVDKPNVTIEDCDSAGDMEAPYDWGFYFTLALLAFIVVFNLIASHMASSSNFGQSYAGYLKAFHMPMNINFLAKITGSDIRSLFGIRVISSIFIVGVHVLLFMKYMGISNALRLHKYLEIITSLSLTLEMTVDTFLFMSGLLFIKGLMTEGSEKFSPIKVIVKRYIRITRYLYLIILVIVTLFKYLPRGPANAIFNREIEACHKNWWASLLMIQNYYDPTNICFPVTWSLAVDFHLSVLATILYWVYLKNRKCGISLFVIGLILSVAIPAAFTYSDHQRNRPLAGDFRMPNDFRDSVFTNEMYIYTHFRAGSYFIGMALGYVMFRYNPTAHRNSITKSHSILGFFVFMSIFLGSFPINYIILTRDFGPIESALFLSLRRVVWAVMIGILGTICEYGTLPIVNNFLSWSSWVFISKLTSGIYLVHFIFVLYSTGTTRNPNQYDLFGTVINTLGIFTLSSIVSFFMWIFYEAPIQNLTSLFLTSGKGEIRREVTKELNSNGKSNIVDLNNKKIM